MVFSGMPSLVSSGESPFNTIAAIQFLIVDTEGSRDMAFLISAVPAPFFLVKEAMRHSPYGPAMRGDRNARQVAGTFRLFVHP